MILAIDFEWRSGSDIKNGLPRYFNDPESQPMCLANMFMGQDEKPGIWIPERDGTGCPTHIRHHVESGGLVRAWNAAFEKQAWDWLTANYGWPVLPWEQCLDSMAWAAAMNLPQSLAQCGEVLGLDEDKLKNPRGKLLIAKLCVPQITPKNRKKQVERWNNDPALMQELYDYCIQDVVTENEICRKLQPLSEAEQLVWVMTQKINSRGVPVDIAEIRNILKVTDAETDRLNAELKVLTEYQVTAASKRQAVLDWCNLLLPEDEQLPDLQAETLEDRMKGELPPKVRRALEIRQAVSQTSIAKLEAIVATADADDTLKNMLVYHGASTGRYASRGGVNLQNIVRPAFDADEIPVIHGVLGTGDHALSSMLFGDDLMSAGAATVRGVLRAKPGHRFVDCDYSSVENRVSAWISGQTDVLEQFANGLDEYKAFASDSLYQVPYDQVDKHMRQVSKSAVLGCMFGQGWRGLIDYAKGYGVTLEEKRSREIVTRYRTKYDRVAACWNACGATAFRALAERGVWHEVNDRIALAVNKVGAFLMMRLPSSRVIRWALPRIEQRETPWGEMRSVITVEQVDSVTRQWRRDQLIGSSIFQSAVQATARDLQVHGVAMAEAAGYHTVLLVHDEILCHEPVGFGSSDELGQLICTLPSWAPDLPLAFEGWEGERFRK